MDPNNPWYTTPTNPQYRRSNSEEQSPIPGNSRGFTNVASQTVQNAQQLLASYPMASPAPTVHAARHLSSLNITAAPPSYVQPSYYSSQPHPSYMGSSSQPPPAYTEYNQQISYLSAPQVPSNQRGYWEDARDTSVRFLNEQASHSHHFQPPRQQQHWPQSTYQTPAFSQSVFQRTVPSAAYPTPPPPGINNASSSLAFALGAPSQQAGLSAPPPPPPHFPVHRPYNPAESETFFNSFLERKTAEMRAAAPLPNPQRPIARMPPPPPPRTPPPKARPATHEESPDPLAMGSNHSTRPNVALTPQKRKTVVEIQSPSAKRIQSYQSMAFIKAPTSLMGTPRTPGSTVPLTPSTTSRTNTSAGSSRPPTSSKASTYGVVTPTPNRIGYNGVGTHDTPDLGGYGSEEDLLASPTRRRTHTDSVKGSARRTGDRDERGPLEKFISAVEEAFEMEDSLPVEIEADDLPQDYFSTLSTDSSRPLLSTALIRKLSKYIGQAARPSKRMRQASAGGMLATPRGRSGRMADVDVQLLSRLLKTLDRSVRVGEDLDPFPQTSAAAPSSTSGAASARSSPTKKSRKVKKAKDGEEDGEGIDDGDLAGELHQGLKDVVSSVVDEIELEKLTRTLDIARDSIVAADCCIALLASDRLPKQLYSEELITGCLNTIKSHLTKVLYPFVEACSPEAISNKLLGVNALLVHLVKPTAGSGSAYASSLTSQANHRRQMSDVFQALSAVLPKINALVNAESVAMSDSIIIQTVYIAIGPFFVVEPGAEHDSSSKSSVSRKEKEKEKDSIVNKTLGKSAMRGLRLDALSLIRSIFANHDDQRSWVIEEILSSLIKLSDTKQKAGQFRLRDGRSIRTVSALLLQLVQTSAHDVRLHARAIEKRRQAKFALKRQESFSESQLAQQQADEPFLDEIDTEEIRYYGTGLESATKAAKTIIIFLNSRSGKGKATKNSNEAEYRAIFDNLIEDVLAVLYWPEWPAAGLLLSIASKFMVSSLDDVKSTSSQADTNAAKTMALDHLGVIAARIRTSILKVQKGTSENGPKYRDLKPLDEVVSSHDTKQFAKVMEAHRDVAAHLCKRSFEDQAYDSARELTAATLCQELAAGLKQVNISLDHPDDDDDLNLRDQSTLLAFGRKVKAALRDVWKDPATDVFDIGSQEEASRIDRVSEEIGTIQSLKNSFHPILNVILMALDAPAIFMRTKALRALGQIVTSDSAILAAPNVRRGIESHLLDSSPAVRDAAVELIGKYMIDSPEVAGDYYQKIADRMADTGLGVRKRVIKLLKSFYAVTDDTQRKIDICTRLVLRMMDEDDTVKDLAAKTVEELWFPPAPLQSAMKGKSGAQSNQDKIALLTKVSVIMGTAANFKDRQSPLEEILHKIIVGREGNEATSLHERYTEICETLIDGLVDATDLPGFTITNCIRTIYLFSSAYPAILSGSNASTLLPYLKNASTAEEVATSDYLLKIFRVSIPHMPKTAAKFGHELQSSLQPMIIKPSGGAVHVLQEAVACMCVVVDHLTHDFSLLINLLKSCNVRLLAFLTLNTAPADVRPMLMLIFIVALLGEHCNFDRLRKERENLAADINAISEGSIIEHIYLALLRIYNKFDNGTLRGRILQCLGFLFRAQPTLMTKEPSADIMDAIFDSPEEEGRGRLLRIMQDFLISESEKHSAKEKESTKNKNKTSDINMDELVGNTDGFADSGVSSAIVQRYLSHILDAALSQNAQIQAAAIDVLTFTIKQGLAHPLQSFPVIIALETSTYPQISNRATALHSILNAKHASLINTRYSISARKSFDYQKKIINGPVRGFRSSPPVALLQRWYSLVREKRQTRQDFLKAMVKVFAEQETYQATQDDVDFTRYMAENFATFEYKTQEEVFTVVKYLTTVLSTTGMQLLDIISPSHLLSHLHSTQPAAPPPPPSATPSMESIPVSTNSDSMDVDAPSTSNPPTMATPQAPKLEGRDPLPLMRTSVIIAMVMLLKSHLKILYSLSEDKCNKFVIGKKSAIGDKPALKRHENPISWDRLAHAITPIHTTHDAEVQKATFLEIWNEDGVTAEPEDEELLL